MTSSAAYKPEVLGRSHPPVKKRLHAIIGTLDVLEHLERGEITDGPHGERCEPAGFLFLDQPSQVQVPAERDVGGSRLSTRTKTKPLTERMDSPWRLVALTGTSVLRKDKA